MSGKKLVSEELLQAKKILYEGGVVAHATETCYGLAVDIFQKRAVDKLYALKKMPLDKPVSILVRDLEEAQHYGQFSSRALKLALQYWPGPLTLVVPRTAVLPQWINYGHPTVGFRVSSHKKTRQLVEVFGGPLTTTSANVHTEPQAYAVADFLAQELQPDFVLDSGRIGENPPSTIVEVIGEELRVIRQGSVVIDETKEMDRLSDSIAEKVEKFYKGKKLPSVREQLENL